MKLRLTIALLLLASYAESSPFHTNALQEFRTPKLPHLRIELSDHNLATLAARRDAALKEHVLESKTNDFVAGNLSIDGKSIPIEIRLKGDFIVHLQGFKWSYRIKVKGNNTVLGMKTFSLHHPRIRLFLHEHVILEALRYEGLIALRYQFLKVSINGTYVGVYNMEEHFETRLLENNQRRDGPIVKIDEDMLFQLINQDLSRTNKDGILFTQSPIDTFQKAKVLRDPIQLAQFEKAKSLLEAFRAGNAAVEDVFDIEEFAKYYAVTDVFMGKHGIRWHNQRFYFNPLTSRLQPIGFDFNDDKPGLDPLSRINREHGIFYGTNWAFDVFTRMLYSEPKFFSAYMTHIDRMTRPAYLRRFFKHIEAQTKIWESALVPEFTGTRFEPFIRFNNRFRNAYKDNQRYVRSAIHAQQPVNLHLMHEDESKTEIIFENRGEFPLQVFAYEINDKRVPIEPPLALPTFRFNHLYTVRRPNVVRYTLPVARRAPTDKVNFIYRTLNNRSSWKLPLGDLSPGGVPTPGLPTITKAHDRQHPTRAMPNWQTFSFLNANKNIISAKPGFWTIDRTLVIGRHSRLQIPAGTHLDFTNGAALVSRSAVDCLGSEDDPVTLSSSDNSGQGIIVMNAEPSTWKYTNINNLSAPQYQEWQPTGVITFYRSPLNMANVQLSALDGEDGLNVLNTTLSLKNVRFETMPSDALDIDFSTGQLEGLQFLGSGNDALDVSGSRLHIKTISVTDAGDKALSVGERSRVFADQITVRDATIAVATKDSSLIDINSLIIENAKIGVAAYQKKPEFGFASADIGNVDMQAVDIPLLLESDARVSIGNQLISDQFGKKQRLLLKALKNNEPLN